MNAVNIAILSSFRYCSSKKFFPGITHHHKHSISVLKMAKLIEIAISA